MSAQATPKKGSYWTGRYSRDTFRVDGILRLDIDDKQYVEDRVIFSRVSPESKSGMTFTLPVSRWQGFAIEVTADDPL